jgi:hypothetical protein
VNGQQQRSWAAKVQALTNFRRLNKAHKRQLIPLPKISAKETQKRLICYSNQHEYGRLPHPLGQSIATSVHNCPPLGQGKSNATEQGKSNATTHGSRRDTRHLPVHKDGQKWETLSSFKHTWMRHSSSPMACQPNTCNNWRRCCKRLEDKSFRANRGKCHFARGAHLGYWLTRQGNTPSQRKSGSDPPPISPAKSASIETFPWHGNLIP